MPLFINKLFISAIFNLSIFLILVIGIQNSNNKSRINFIINKTVELPISFIIGVSFITGSLTGTFLSLEFQEKNP